MIFLIFCKAERIYNDERRLREVFYGIFDRQAKNSCSSAKNMIYYISNTENAIYIRPYRLAVRTAPSHGANSGSSPDKVTNERTQQACVFLLESLSD